ncbi:sulfite reductase [NADPH] hemoprotein beta-component [Shewanella sp. NFH-SH190041]|uniref:NADPH-dependent assimilatory sulfite reductase hemoprotein subunit n=1 Tax=Shewanella sp. NFH-SH190041 TaxID=2950245 RepID=UPI0021C376E4|nr:NADPH-dependent assimilatory sulfite reductase hemoprotein subunit [Shewanella sp. NFH-SH190041]BDM65557.1 sulfite reductase [NADPH] hemoprotein beta-component [Shewanella sp. NFH-SH190041]
MTEKKLAENEYLKRDSRLLRGTITEGLATQVTGAFAAGDQQLIKFHGFYQQDDRDLRRERAEQKLEPLYSFMLRARVAGGVCTTAQWLGVDSIASELTHSHSIRLTSRQTFQYHGIAKRNLKTLIQGLDRQALDSIAACGDVNRNVMCSPNPQASILHTQVQQWAKQLSDELLPHTRAYAEIWLDGETLLDTAAEQEPIYGETYLPRKFKMAIAVPPDNDVDVYTNDLGLIAIADGEQLIGFNMLIGGGMGCTHGDHQTFPRLAEPLGFVSLADTMAAVKAVMTVQRDWGNRENRRRARLKYTVEDHGLDKVKAEVSRRANVVFQPAKTVTLTNRGDRYGWHEGADGLWHLTLFIEGGRISDQPDQPLQTGLREIAKCHQGEFRLTANQNLIVSSVTAEDKAKITALAEQYGLLRQVSASRGLGIACVALPTCPLAMAEAERYFPSLLSQIEALQQQHDIAQQPMVIRMTGCPNGCARPFAAEIGMVGKSPGRYNLYLGGSFNGDRLNKCYRENQTEAEILSILDSLFRDYASERLDGEGIGDFCVRVGRVKAVINAAEDFYD